MPADWLGTGKHDPNSSRAPRSRKSRQWNQARHARGYSHKSRPDDHTSILGATANKIGAWTLPQPKQVLISWGGLQGNNDISIEQVTLNCAKTAPPEAWEQEIARVATSGQDDDNSTTPLHTWFTDGSGLENGQRGGAAWCPSTNTPIKQYLGRLATVHDGELVGIDCALKESSRADILLLTDSQAAIQTTLNLAKGVTPRSGIERSIMERLVIRKQQGKRTRIAWVKAHAGITGNEKADQLAKQAALLRLQRNGTEVITAGGL